MVQQVNRDSIYFNSPTDSVFGAPWGVYEEYWYDALGRRVLKRSRQESPICTDTDRCYSAIERYVWDGAQILWEFRQANAGDNQDPNPTASNGQTGHVGYVHAGGIDLPLGMIRNDTAVVLHRDHRGLYYGATTTAGGALGFSVPWPSTSSTVSQSAFYPRIKHTWMGPCRWGISITRAFSTGETGTTIRCRGNSRSPIRLGSRGGSMSMGTPTVIRSIPPTRSGWIPAESGMKMGTLLKRSARRRV